MKLTSFECLLDLFDKKEVKGPCYKNPKYAGFLSFELYEDKGSLYV